MPSGKKRKFRWLCPIEKQSVTNTLSANSLRFAQIYFFAMCLFYKMNYKQNVLPYPFQENGPIQISPVSFLYPALI